MGFPSFPAGFFVARRGLAKMMLEAATSVRYDSYNDMSENRIVNGLV